MLTRVFAGLALLAVTSAHATDTGKLEVIYNALGGAQNGGDSFKTGGSFLLDEVQNDKKATLTSVVLTLKAQKTDLRNFRVLGFGVDANGKPFHLTLINTLRDSKLTKKFQEITVKPLTTITLAAHRLFYVGIGTDTGGRSSVVLGNTLTKSVIDRPSVVAGMNYYNTAGGVQPNAGGPYQIKVNVTSIN